MFRLGSDIVEVTGDCNYFLSAARFTLLQIATTKEKTKVRIIVFRCRAKNVLNIMDVILFTLRNETGIPSQIPSDMGKPDPPYA